MAAPLMPRQLDPDTRTLAFSHRTAQGLDQRLDVRKDDRGGRRPRKDRSKCSAVAGIHEEMLSRTDITSTGRLHTTSTVLSLISSITT